MPILAMAVLMLLTIGHFAVGLGPLVLIAAVPVVLFVVAYPPGRLLERLTRRPAPARPGYLGLWLTGVVYLAVTIVPLVTEDAERSPAAKARTDVQAIRLAVERYAAHCGGPPPPGPSSGTGCSTTREALRGGTPQALLLRQVNGRGETAGPFLAAIPALPPGWTGTDASYQYTLTGGGGFVVCARGDGTAVDSAGGDRCP